MNVIMNDWDVVGWGRKVCRKAHKRDNIGPFWTSVAEKYNSGTIGNI